MRHFLFVGALAGAVACEPDAMIVRVDVRWMDWPAEVVANVPFKTHLIVAWTCGAMGFRPGAAVDLSAVTFEPYYVEQVNAICALDQPVSLDVFGSLDTAGVVPGLRADFPRTYEMRAAANAYALQLGLNADGLPIRTFGEVKVVVVSIPERSPYPRNAAGLAYQVRDALGCLRINPSGLYPTRSTIVIENPVDTVTHKTAFVRGYIYAPQAPVCGQDIVFHLVSRN